VSAKKTDRLVNLVIALLATRRYLTVEQIRRAVPGYGDPGDARAEDAFRRMFERDKEELRSLGIPLETGSHAVWDDEPGYRIAGRDYALPDLALEPDETAALGLAARLWASTGLAEASRSALRKLSAAGVEVDGGKPGDLDVPAGDGLPGIVAGRVDAGDPAFEPCLAAVRDGRAVQFDYTSADGRAAQRSVEPWGVVSWHGRWYLVGHDRDRDAMRVFRLSRMTGPVRVVGPSGAVHVPAGVDLKSSIASFEGEPVRATALLRVRAGTGFELRREALGPPTPDDGWDRIDLGYSEVERLADVVAGYGADVVVLGPAEARDAVVRRLRAAAGEAP
jgi:proteasome accessory factor B